MRWVLAMSLLVGCDIGEEVPPLPPQKDRVLAFTRMVAGGHEEAAAAAQEVLPARLLEENLETDFTDDPALFTEENLNRYRAVIFLYTNGDVLDETGEAALERFVRLGGGWLGVHSAADTEPTWPFYKTMLVTYFKSHPPIQPATVTIALPGHAAVANVPVGPWIASDEWYDFNENPRAVLGVDVLATVDEATYTGGMMGTDHPVAWAQERLIGRTVYTSLGHSAERWQEPAFVEHIASAVRWVTGLAL